MSYVPSLDGAIVQIGIHDGNLISQIYIERK